MARPHAVVVALVIGLLGCDEGESSAGVADATAGQLDEYACDGAERARKRDQVAAIEAERDEAIGRHELAITHYHAAGFDVVADAAREEIAMIRRSFAHRIAEVEGRRCADMHQN